MPKNPHIRRHEYEPVSTVEEAREYHLRLAAEEKIIQKESEDEDE